MSPLLPFVVGIAAFIGGVLVLRSYGSNFRVGRLLASTPTVSVAEARDLAVGGSRRYVKVSGRIDAEEEFEDDAHRPLVFRRTRLQLQQDRGWTTFEDRRERVRFEVREGLDAIVVDDAALDTGLVVIPRESIGTANDVADRIPPGTAPGAVVRLRIEQVSSIEHAIVLGVPGLGDDGEPRLSAGLGRPLVLTTLEPDEAMRVLADGRPRRTVVAVACFAGGLGLMVVAVALAAIGAGS